MAIWAKNPYFWPPGGSKRGENEFLGKKRKRHVLTLPKTKFHAKNQKNLSRGFPGKLSERERQTERATERQRETDPNIRVLRTLSLSRRTKNVPRLSAKRALCSWWKIYLDYLRSAQYAADEKLPWLSAKRAADEKCTLVFGEAYCALLVKICTMVIWKARSAQLA